MNGTAIKFPVFAVLHILQSSINSFDFTASSEGVMESAKKCWSSIEKISGVVSKCIFHIVDQNKHDNDAWDMIRTCILSFLDAFYCVEFPSVNLIIKHITIYLVLMFNLS